MKTWILAFLMTSALSAAALGLLYLLGIWNIGGPIGVALVLPQMTYICHDMLVARKRALQASDAGGITKGDKVAR